MIVTDNQRIYEICSSLSNQGRDKNSNWLYHNQVGYNYRMDEMSAALGVSQLKKLNKILDKRKNAAKIYIEQLEKIDGVILPKIGKNNIHSWFVFTIRVEKNINRDKVINILKKRGIGCKPYFYPCIHLQPFYKKTFGFREGDFPVAERVSKTIMSLPFYTDIKQEDILKVCSELKDAIERCKT